MLRFPKMTRLPALCFAMAIGCGGPTRGPQAANLEDTLDLPTPASGPAKSEPVSDVACYFGQLRVTPAGGAETEEGDLLVRLTLDRRAGRIIEDTMAFPLYERFLVTRTIDGNNFTMVQDDGSFRGVGELDGAPWQWSGWRSTTRSSDGLEVSSETELVSGKLVTHEQVLNADGSLRTSLRHALAPIEASDCDKRFAEAEAEMQRRELARKANAERETAAETARPHQD